jgi:ubiquinone/menaquinone biosynthesis C-methylase UbiE
VDEKAVVKLEASRVTRSKALAKSNYDRLSGVYDLIAASEVPYIDQGLQILGLIEGESVLEIGFGTGRAILAMAKAVGDTGKVCGIDISEGMLAVAREKVQQAALSHRVELSCDDAAALHYAADSFDAVFMSFTLELFDNPQVPLVLAECRRVLKTTGRICVVALSKPANPGIAVRLYEWAHSQFPVLVDCRPIYVQDELHEAGFQVVNSIKKSMWGLPVEIVLACPAG